MREDLATGAMLDGAVNGAAPGASDSRSNQLYAGERRSLSFREALRIVARSWPYIAAHRRLVIIKTCVAVFSMTLFLITPWPAKIIIDNVIDGHPLTGLPGRILLPIAGTNRVALLTAVVLILLVTVVFAGTSGDRPSGVDARVASGGLDQASFTANDANNGWSLWTGLLGLFEVWITLDLTQRVNQDLRVKVYERFLRSPLGLYGDQKIGDAVFRVMHDSAGIAEVFYSGMLAPLLSLVMFGLALTVLSLQFSNEPIIPIAAACMLPVVALGSTLFARIFRDQVQRMREQGSNVMAVFEERLAHVHLIKAYGSEGRETRAVDAASWESYRATLRMIVYIMIATLIVAPALGYIYLRVVYGLMNQVIEKRITLGDVVLLISYGMMLSIPMTTIGATWATLQGPISGLRRIFSVLDRLEEGALTGGNGAADPGRISGVEFRDVAIAYGGEPIVRDISFELRTGELAALAGPSGTGKTTVICSIPRFFQPCAGQVLINRVDAAQIPLDVLRARVGFVFQQEALFSRTIGDNIRYGVPGASDAAMREAARKAGAADFIEALAQKYDTMLGRRGARLSVGQKQRIAIARALIRHPDVLILDEPTAPLDPGSEADLMQTLREISRERIVLLVAHRPGTLAACDRVVFMNGGSVAAIGTHEELLRTCMPYRDYLAIAQSEINP
jgi:ABC-type multidrug transport system fused ATPase/permease subunit